MRFLEKAKDGGPESHVTGYFLVEIKPLFSIVLLHFANGTREAFHTHAFNALTWIVKGRFEENRMTGIKDGKEVVDVRVFPPSLRPKRTLRNCLHKVFSIGDTWALSFRGPWANTWTEYLPAEKKFVILTHGRKIVD